MAGTVKNFLNNAIDRGAEIAQATGDWLSNKAQGLRAPATPAPEAAVERPLSGAARSAVHGQEYTRNMSADAFRESPGNAKSWTGATEAAVDAEFGSRPQGLREPSLAEANAQARSARNPYLNTPEGQAGVQRAQTWGSKPPPPTGPAGASAASSFPEVPKAPGGLRGLARGAARFAGPLAAASGVPDQLSNGATNMDEQIVQELGSPGFSPVSTPAGSAFRSAAGNALSLARRTGNALTFGLQGGDRVIGGIRDVAQGNLLGTTQFDESAPRPAAPRNAAPAQPASGQPASDGGYMDVLDGRPGSAKATPEAIMATNLRPVAGTGVIKRTTPGNVGPAEGIGAPGDYRGENSYVASDRKAPGMRDAAIPGATSGGTSGATQPGVFGELAAVQGMRQRLSQNQYGERMGAVQRGQDITQRGQDIAAETTRRGQDVSAATTRAQLRFEAGRDNRKNIESQIASHADAMTPVVGSGVFGTEKGAAAARAEAKTQYGNDLRGRMEWSLADRKDGRTVEELSPTEFNQLLLMDKVRRKVEDKRSEVGQSVRDFFGNKRFNGQSLYGYGPTKVEAANDGGFVVHFGNGNTAKADIVGGDFKWLTPNAPVDADIQALVAPLIREARQRSR